MTDQHDDEPEQKNECRGFDVTIWETMGDKVFTHTKIGEVLNEIANKYAFQLEEGEEKKRRHFQIRLNTIKKTRWRQLTKLFVIALDVKGIKGHIHIRPTSKGVHSKRNFNYVLKADTRILGPWTEHDFNEDNKQYIPIPLRGITRDKLRPFQQSLLDMTNIYDDRAIDFIYDPTGNYGKGFAADYLEIYNDCYILPSIDDYKLIIQDAHNFITSRINRFGEKGRNVKAFILDMPRVMKMDDMHNLIGAIETIKGGRFVDYRHKSSAIVRIEKPRVFVFTNKGIDLTLYSKDRFKIWRITEKLELKPYTFPTDDKAYNLEFKPKEKKIIRLI
nr:putative replication associated protein [Crucivirus sp.]